MSIQTRFTYVYTYTRRRGWFTKPNFGATLIVDADADFELETITIDVLGASKQHFADGYNLQFSADARTFWKAPVWYYMGSPTKLAIPYRVPAGTCIELQFFGDRFKLDSRLEVQVRLSGAKVYKDLA